MNKIPNRRIFLSLAFRLVVACAVFPPLAHALTVAEVVKDLACPCECPLILEDCNMNCGLEWKEEVGEQIKKGMNKEQIMEYFITKYGESARLTPIQRIQGKTYQYTRESSHGYPSCFLASISASKNCSSRTTINPKRTTQIPHKFIGH